MLCVKHCTQDAKDRVVLSTLQTIHSRLLPYCPEGGYKGVYVCFFVCVSGCVFVMWECVCVCYVGVCVSVFVMWECVDLIASNLECLTTRKSRFDGCKMCA